MGTEANTAENENNAPYLNRKKKKVQKQLKS